MRLTICLTGALLVAACSQQGEAPASVDNAAAPSGVETAPANGAAANGPVSAVGAGGATMVTANGSTPGTYEVTTANGSVSRLALNGDGTYSETNAEGAETERGRWTVTDGKTCFDPDGDKVAACYAESPVGEDGSYTATREGADPVTVKKVG